MGKQRESFQGLSLDLVVAIEISEEGGTIL